MKLNYEIKKKAKKVGGIIIKTKETIVKTENKLLKMMFTT